MRTETSVKRVLFCHSSKLIGLCLFVATSLLLSTIFISTPSALAATNNTLNFQARLETSSGAIVPDGNYDVTFHLFSSATPNGTEGDTTCGTDTNCEWTESYTYNSGSGSSDVRVRVANGYLSVNLGSITSFPGTINWDQQQWLTMDIGGTTGSGTITWDGQMSPRLQLTGVPYAFQAASAHQLQVLQGGSTGTLSFTTLTASRNVVLPDAAGTVCLDSGNCNGSGGGAGYIVNGTVQQTANFNINGTGQLATLDATGAGTGNTLAIGSTASSTGDLNLGTSATSGNVTIGGTSQTGNITIGQSQVSNTISIGSSVTGSGNTQTINIGTSTGTSSTTTVNVGSSNTGSTTTLKAGATSETLTNSGDTIKTTTNSTTAFQVQNSGGASQLAIDTTNGNVTTTNLNVGSAANVNAAGRIFSDGFEGGSFKQWTLGTQTSGSSTVAIDTGTVHDGKYSSKFVESGSGAAYVDTALSTSATNFSLRAYVNLSSVSTTLSLIRTFNASTNGFAGLYLDSTGHLGILHNAGTLVAGSQVLPTGSWHEVELRYTIASGTATLTAYLDGVQSATTSTGTTSTPNRIRAGDPTTHTGTFYLDDIVLDTGTNGAGVAAGLNVADSLHVSGNSSLGGSLYVQPAADTTQALLVQNASGTTVFDVDTSNGRVGIGTNAPAKPLDVAGDINTSTQYDIGGSAILSSSALSFTAASTASVDAASGQTLNVGTNSTHNTFVGSTSSTSSLTLQSGTGNLSITTQGTGQLNIGNNAVAQTINIGNATGATTVSVLCGTGACGFGNNAIAHTTTVGSATGAAGTTIQAGSGGISLSDSTGAINFTGGAASTWSIGSGNALTITSSNFNVSGSATTLGSSSSAGSLILQDGAGKTATLQLLGTLSVNQTYNLPTTGGTICIQSSATCGFESTTGTDFIQNQNATTQTANFNISGIGIAGTLEASTFDTASAGALNIGLTSGGHATSINLNQNTTVNGSLTVGTNTIIGSGTGDELTMNGASGYTLLNGNSGWGVNVQADYLQLVGGGLGHVQLQFSTDTNISRGAAGVLDVGNGTYQDHSGTLVAGALQAATVDATSGILGVGTSNASAITLGKSTTTTTEQGNLDIAGSLATQKGTDYATTGASNNVNFGNVSLVRLTGASAQTITGIANGRNGYVLTIVNAGSSAATLKNNDTTDSSAANVILTGTGSDLSLVAGASIEMVYDSGASVWRVVGATASVGSSSGVTTVGTFSSSSQTNGASISGNTITFGPADATNPGMVSTLAQTFAGTKTFNGGVNVASGQAYQVAGSNVLTASALSFTAASTATIQPAASQALNITAHNSSTFSTDSGTLTVQSASTLSLGNAISPTITMQSASGGTINIGNNGVADTIQIGQNGANAVTQTIAIGNGGTGSTTNLTLGNINGGSTTIQGAAGISLTTNSSSAGTTVKTNTDSASAFQVQNHSGNNILSVNTSTGQTILGTPNAVSGALVFENSGDSNTITLSAPATTNTSYSLNLPTSAPSPGLCLATSAASGNNLVFSSCTQVSGAVISYVSKWDYQGSPVTSASVSPTSKGDLLILSATEHLNGQAITSVTGGDVSTWSKVTYVYNGLTGSNQRAVEMWRGVVTSLGTSPINVTFSGSAGSNEIAVTEYTIGNSSAAWNVDSAGTQNNSTNSTTITYPNLTPQESNELYAGYGYSNDSGTGSATGGSTTGFTYLTTGAGNIWAYNTAINGGTATQPTATQTTSGPSLAVGVFIVGFGANTAILNSPNVQSANFNVQAATSGSVAGVLQGDASGAADILDIYGGTTGQIASNEVLGVTGAGNLLFGNGDSNPTISVAAQTTTNANGNGLTLQAGAANGTGTGGTLTLQGGAAAATAGSSGGGVAISGANGTSTGTGGAGGNITLTAGSAGGTGNNNGGTITLQPGTATGTGTAGGVLIPYVGSGSTSAFAIGGSGGGTFLTVNNTTNANEVQIGGSNCASTIGVGRVCNYLSSGSSPGSSTVQVGFNTTNKLIGTSTGSASMYDYLGYLTDTSTGGTNKLYGLDLDASGTTNTSSTINSIQATAPAANPGSLLLLQGCSGTSCGTVTNVLNVSNTGATTLKNQANSTNAFQVQTAGSGQLFNIDTSTSTVTIGTASNGVTFTAGTLEPVLNGSARHTRTISLAPEYANDVMTAPASCGSGSSGTMTSDMDTTNWHSYYNWTTTQTSTQCYDVWVRVALPSDFSAWPSNAAGPSVSVYTKVSNTSNADVQLGITDTANATARAVATLTPTTSWAQQTASITTGSWTWSADGYMTLQVRVEAKSSATAQIGEISIPYLSKW